MRSWKIMESEINEDEDKLVIGIELRVKVLVIDG
jgi:hypothetical protein